MQYTIQFAQGEPKFVFYIDSMHKVGNECCPLRSFYEVSISTDLRFIVWQRMASPPLIEGLKMAPG